VLSIGKLVAGQERYYEQQVAMGADDYYTGRGEVQGRWMGSGAAALGLDGEVEAEAFGALIAGRDPGSGEALRSPTGRDRVCSLDLTFSAPKSASVLFAIGDEETSRSLVEAHEEAVAAAVSYLEREACRVRRGHAGRIELPADGFVAAAYRHRMSRAAQPQLHTHVVAANLARGSDGRWSALHGYPIFRHAKAAGSLYQAHLRAAVCERLPWADWGEVRKGMAELEGVPTGVLAHFSRRRAEIVERLQEDERSGRQSAEKAALATRTPKADPVALGPWRERVGAEAAEHGFGRAELAALTRQAERVPARPIDLERVGAFLAGPAGLTARRNSFEARHAVIELAAAHAGGARAADVEAASRAFLRRGEVVPLAGGADDGRYTTASLLACERRIVADAVRGQRMGTAVVDRDLVDQAVTDLPARLSDEQVAAVRGIATSGNTVDVVEALAGTGKTTVAGALAVIYQQAGYRVIGAAPTGRAARELSSRAGIPASTLHRLGDDLRRGDGFGPDPAVLLLDEAGMAPTRVSADVLAAAHRGGVKVVALGDSGQLSSVEAGGWLGALSQRLEARELRAVVRQRDPAERAALAELHGGEPDRWLALKRERGEVVVHVGGPQAAQEAAMAAWRADVAEVGVEQPIMIVRDNQTRAELNEQARAWRDARGELGARIEVGGLEVAVGDRVIARRNDRELDVDNGTRGTVRAVDPDTKAISIETDNGQVRQLPADYVAAHLEHAYALTGHGSQGATVDRAVVVGGPEDFTNEWAYTALSRARDSVHVHVTAARDDRSDRSEIAPTPPDRTAEEAIDAMRMAMRRREREDLAIDQAVPLRRAPVPGEAAAEANESAQRQQLALDLDRPAITEPVPEVLRDLREPEPLWGIQHRVGIDQHEREAIEGARQKLSDVPRETLAEQAERLDELAKTFPHNRVEAAQRADQLSRLREHQREAHEHIGRQLAQLDRLGPLSRVLGRANRRFSEEALASWSQRAQEYDEQVAELGHRVDVDRHERAAWFEERGGEFAELSAAKVELHDRDRHARERRVDDLRHDPPAWVIQRLGPRPDAPAAREQWDRAAASLDDYRHAFGHPPGDKPPDRGDYRERDAWKEVHEAAAKALEIHPERPVVERPPPALSHDIGLEIGL
jgi:conjugative relaxase-like TrwC/TraI family protein